MDCTVKNWQTQVNLLNKMLQHILLLLALPYKEIHKFPLDTVGLQRQINSEEVTTSKEILWYSKEKENQYGKYQCSSARHR